MRISTAIFKLLPPSYLNISKKNYLFLFFIGAFVSMGCTKVILWILLFLFSIHVRDVPFYETTDTPTNWIFNCPEEERRVVRWRKWPNWVLRVFSVWKGTSYISVHNYSLAWIVVMNHTTRVNHPGTMV